MTASQSFVCTEERFVPRMNAYRAVYPGPQRQANAPAPASGRTELGAMSYVELGKGTVEEHETVQSTVLNRIASGNKDWAHGKDLNEHTVITAPRQYQGVALFPERFKGYLDGTAVFAQNAAQAERNLRQKGPTTNATSYIAHLDGSPPTDEEVMRLGNVEHASPAAKVGRVYLYAPKTANPKK